MNLWGPEKRTSALKMWDEWLEVHIYQDNAVSGEEEFHLPFKILLAGLRISSTADRLTGENKT